MSSLEPQVYESADNSASPEQAEAQGVPGNGEPAKKSWSPKARAAVAAGVVAAAVAVGGGVVYASSHTSAGSNSQQGGFGNRGGFPGQSGQNGQASQAGAANALSNALYGEFVASNGTTMVFQTGTVTAISATSLTVKSSDNHSATYTLASSSTVDGGQATAANVKTGHQVTVVATKSDSKITTITDTTLLGNSGSQQGGQNGFPGNGQGGAPGGGAAPTGTARPTR